MEDITTASSAEWEVMRVIWSLDEATSRSVSEVLKDTQNWEVATTKTLLGRLVKKGYLDTRKDGNRFIYLPLVTEEESVSNRVDKLFTSICNSAVGGAIAKAIDTHSLSKKDREIILAALEAKEFVESVPCSCLPNQTTKCNCETDNCKCGHNNN